MKFKTIEWKEDRVRLLDQRRLPHDVVYVDCRDAFAVAKAIRNMTVRGAPAIGIAAAMGIALAGRQVRTQRPEMFVKEMERVCQRMSQTRPTAVNLFWAVDRMRKILEQVDQDGIEATKRNLEERPSRSTRRS